MLDKKELLKEYIEDFKYEIEAGLKREKANLEQLHKSLGRVYTQMETLLKADIRALSSLNSLGEIQGLGNSIDNTIGKISVYDSIMRKFFINNN